MEASFDLDGALSMRRDVDAITISNLFSNIKKEKKACDCNSNNTMLCK